MAGSDCAPFMASQTQSWATAITTTLHAQQRATFTGQPLIAEIWQGGVVFCAYQEDSWKALTPERTGRYVFQQESDLKLTIDGIQQNLKDRASCEPMIYFEPDGLMSHFVLSIKNDAGTATLTVNDENQLFIR